jgi:hypothetical protein
MVRAPVGAMCLSEEDARSITTLLSLLIRKLFVLPIRPCPRATSQHPGALTQRENCEEGSEDDSRHYVHAGLDVLLPRSADREGSWNGD